MEDQGRPRRLRLAKVWVWVMACYAMPCDGCSGQAVAVQPRWRMDFPAMAVGGRPAESTVVPVGEPGLVVAVVVPGADGSNPGLRVGARALPVELLGHDPVSRLGFFRVQGSLLPKQHEWLNSAESCIGKKLRAVGPAGEVTCQVSGWVKQVGGKILPLALLGVDFEGGVPPTGTPLLDRDGRVAALLFQAAAGPAGGRTGYAIPAEAVHRVRRDVAGGGPLVRGWLGLSLLAENQKPQVVRVLADSPAAAAGIQPGDMLVSVGTRQIQNYPDAANAFFYLTPGQPVTVKLQRGAKQIVVTLTPIPPRAG
jgi:S1-C subfamily serine protease